jgi:hypothetical protein
MRNADVVVHEEDPDGALLFNPENDRIFVLNGTGFFIWDLCTGDLSLAQIAERIKTAFEGVPEADIETDVEQIVQDLSAAGFVNRKEE